jgi:hypothetical protein
LVILAALGAACDPGSIRLTPRVESVRLTAAPDTVEVGERAEFQAQVLDPSEHPLSGKRVYWGSSDTTVLQIDPVTGVARARAPGRVQIAASSEDKYAEATVEIPAGPTISFGTTMMDQLSANDDVDEFTFNGNAGQEFNVMLQGNSGVAAHRFRLRLLGPGRSVIDSVISNGNDPGLRAQAIKWLPLPQNGLYTVRIDGNTGGEQGSYRVLVEAINRAPEKAAATLTLPVSVTGESLTPGDVDIYTFSGTAGQEISATFSSSMGSGADALKLSVITPTAGELVFVQYNRDYTRSQGTGRRLLTQTGTYTIRVQGAADAEDQGDYNFQISIISRAPEVAAPGVALGTVVANEQIAPLGDFDEFTLAVPSTTQEVNVYLQAPVGPSGDSLLLRVLSPAGARVDSVTSTGNNTDLYGQAISHLKVGTGTYRLQVEGGRNTRGTYKFQVRPINLAPEHVSSTVTYGTLLTAEDISPVGDVDQFNLDVPVSATVTFSFQATSGKGADVLRLTVIPPTGGELFYLQPTGDQPGQSATRNLNPGKYVIRVEGVNSTDDSGFYRLQVVKVN